MIERKFRERAVRAMFPSVSYDSPLWTSFVELGEEATNAAAVRVAREMEAISKEATFQVEPPTLPALPKIWTPGRGDQVVVRNGHRYAGARGRLLGVADGARTVVEMEPSGMFRALEVHHFSLSDLEPAT